MPPPPSPRAVKPGGDIRRAAIPSRSSETGDGDGDGRRLVAKGSSPLDSASRRGSLDTTRHVPAGFDSLSGFDELAYAVRSDVGVRRSHNQDAHAEDPAADPERFAVHGHLFLV